jgi:hypothetical protein
MTRSKRPQGPKGPSAIGEGNPFEPQEPPQSFDYKALLREALLSVPRQALTRVAEEGMPEGHHFYLSFRPRDPQVDAPAFLRDQYPEELTIILQHQFWSLEVDDEAFSVVLSFGGRRHRLFVPFMALTAFADPYANFGLRFDTAGEPAEDPNTQAQPEEAPAAPPGTEETPGGVLRFDPSRRK